MQHVGLAVIVKKLILLFNSFSINTFILILFVYSKLITRRLISIRRIESQSKRGIHEASKCSSQSQSTFSPAIRPQAAVNAILWDPETAFLNNIVL